MKEAAYPSAAEGIAATENGASPDVRQISTVAALSPAHYYNYLIAGATRVERQHFIIRELERDGHDAAQARQILKQLQRLGFR
jgi:hypothetical protein